MKFYTYQESSIWLWLYRCRSYMYNTHMCGKCVTHRILLAQSTCLRGLHIIYTYRSSYLFVPFQFWMDWSGYTIYIAKWFFDQSKLNVLLAVFPICHISYTDESKIIGTALYIPIVFHYILWSVTFWGCFHKIYNLSVSSWHGNIIIFWKEGVHQAPFQSNYDQGWIKFFCAWDSEKF